MVSLDDRDREVLRVLAGGRANPKLIREETGEDKGDLNTILVRLGRAGYVRQVTRGLYEITNDGREEIDANQTEIDRATLEGALDDLEEAMDRGDGRAAQDALQRAREAVGGR